MTLRRASAFAALFAVAAAVMIGCGSSYDLPTENRGSREIPTDQSYQLLQTWAGTTGIKDILLTQGTGTQLFLLFNLGGTGTAQRGGVLEFFLTRPTPTGRTFLGGMFNPAALTSGGDGFGAPNNRVYVLDQGDTCLAKIRPGGATCSPIGIQNLGSYWRVREYGLLGGDTVSTFTDTTLAFVDGIAADAQGNVYVSGTAIVTFRDQSQPGLVYREFSDRIFKYSRGPRYPGVTPPDRTMPGANWHRDTTYAVSEGSGIGYVNDPRGLAWGAAGSEGLYVADFSNNSAQKLDDRLSGSGFFRLDGADGPQPMNGPTDIAVDASGFIYVADTGNRRVVRHDPFGAYVQRVDIEGPTLVDPIAVAADDSLVYIADRGLAAGGSPPGSVLRYQRRK